MYNFHLPNLNWVDYTIIAIIGFSTLISLVRGFLREAISLLTWVIAFWVAFKFGAVLADLFTNYIHTPSLRHIIAFALLFIVVLILGGLINFLLHELVSCTGLSGTDRVLGMVFGLARGVMLVAALLLLGNMTSMSKDPWWQKSEFIPHFKGIVTWMHRFVPDKVAGEEEMKLNPDL